MNALQQFKQKGRILRKFLAKAFSSEVKLSTAYEAIAVMEGATNWNEFSSRLATPDSKAKSPSTQVVQAEALPPIRAIFRTVDGKGVAEFEASPWFTQASQESILALLEEKPRMAPIGFELSYGGVGGVSDGVAEFCAAYSPDVQKVYAYIQALSAVGQDCGGSDCYINTFDVHQWLDARKSAQEKPQKPSAVNLVLDTQLNRPENDELLRNVCQAAWEHAVDDWQHWLEQGGNCEYIIQSTNIFNAMSDYNIVSTGEDGYSDEGERIVEDALHKFGYQVQAVMLYDGSATLEDKILGVVPFSRLNEGDVFRDPSTQEVFRKSSVHRAELQDKASGQVLNETKFFSTDVEVHLVARVAPWATPSQVHPKESETVILGNGSSVTANFLRVVEVNLGDVLEEYDTPDDVEEWQWVEKHHSFAHKGNGEEGGVWEFMVHVGKAAANLPERLRPFFDQAKRTNAQWVMFHQG